MIALLAALIFAQSSITIQVGNDKKQKETDSAAVVAAAKGKQRAIRCAQSPKRRIQCGASRGLRDVPP